MDKSIISNPPNFRIPFRPLSYKNVALCYNREIMIDYDNDIIYYKDDNGEIRNITASMVKLTIDDILNNLDKIDFAHNITVNYNGNIYKLDELLKIITDLQNSIANILGREEEVKKDDDGNIIKDEDGNPIIISVYKTIERIFEELEKVKQDNTSIKEELENIKDEVSIKTVTYRVDFTIPTTGWTTIAANKDYYISIPKKNIKETDIGFVFFNHSTNYDTMLNECTQSGYIYKVLTNNDSITIYSKKIPTISLNMFMIISRTIIGVTDSSPLPA